jgi:hypothetical protein
MGFYTLYKKQKEYRYMKKTIKRKQKLGIRIGVGCALVITVILLAVQGVSNLTKKPVDTSEGIAYIKGKESADAKTIEQKINQLEKKDGTGDSSDTRSMKERFSGAVVMGDSIAASFTEYDVLLLRKLEFISANWMIRSSRQNNWIRRLFFWHMG